MFRQVCRSARSLFRHHVLFRVGHPPPAQPDGTPPRQRRAPPIPVLRSLPASQRPAGATLIAASEGALTPQPPLLRPRGSGHFRDIPLLLRRQDEAIHMRQRPCSGIDGAFPGTRKHFGGATARHGGCEGVYVGSDSDVQVLEVYPLAPSSYTSLEAASNAASATAEAVGAAVVAARTHMYARGRPDCPVHPINLGFSAVAAAANPRTHAKCICYVRAAVEEKCEKGLVHCLARGGSKRWECKREAEVQERRGGAPASTAKPAFTAAAAAAAVEQVASAVPPAWSRRLRPPSIGGGLVRERWRCPSRQQPSPPHWTGFERARGYGGGARCLRGRGQALESAR